MSEPKRIAQIVGKWVGGGVEAVIMNYYRNIDKSKIQFDFLCDEDSTNIPYEEIESLGGRVILIPPYQKPFKYHKELKRILKENKYEIVHSHINTMSVFPLFAAWCAKVPVRIAHSHSSIVNNRRELKRNIIKNFLKHFSRLFATDYFACSNMAAESQFGKKSVINGKVKIINNAIDVEKFEFNSEKRSIKRRELGINDNTVVFGHIGRFVETKNHDFIIDLFNEYLKINSDSKLLLIGQGPLLERMKEKVCSIGLEEHVVFLGQRNDTCDLYQVMDLFVFPSLYEGLGMVLIEAQNSGLPCLASNTVPSVAKISDICRFIDLNATKSIWIENISDVLNNYIRLSCKESVKKSGFDISLESKKLVKIYEDLFVDER